MQTSTEIMLYQNPPATDEAVPFRTAITPPTAGHRLSTRMIAIVVASIVLVAGGTVWMQGDPRGSSFHPHGPRYMGSRRTQTAYLIPDTPEGLPGRLGDPCGGLVTGSFQTRWLPNQDNCCQHFVSCCH